jgi:hypothetical protein
MLERTDKSILILGSRPIVIGPRLTLPRQLVADLLQASGTDAEGFTRKADPDTIPTDRDTEPAASNR